MPVKGTETQEQLLTAGGTVKDDAVYGDIRFKDGSNVPLVAFLYIGGHSAFQITPEPAENYGIVFYSWQELSAEQATGYGIQVDAGVTIPGGWSVGTMGETNITGCTAFTASASTVQIADNANILNDFFSKLFLINAASDTTVDLQMSNGNQVISPASGEYFSKVTVKKPTTLSPENIKKDVNIGGVVGTLAWGGGGSGGDFKADGTVPMTGNLNMNGKSIIGVHSISNTNIGLAIESETSLNNHKITDLLDPTADQDAATKKYVDDHSLLGSDGLIDTDLNMNEHAIINAHKISTDGPAPLYIGATIEATGTNAPRLTGATDGTAAFVKADTQSEYVAISVGAPTAANHAVTKEYSDGKTNALQASALLKSGGTMVGKLKLTAEPTDDNDAVDIGYLKTNNYVALPAWTAEDAGKILTVGADGTLTWATPSAST